ncbi:flagellar motor switch protein FliN [Thioalkalivibrio sp.]|uniref:flagellar motor switch protein FliN n=1 Tax=Thioalkalivibrio sp. TaxID=2093813 RepID=UPI0039755F6D
MSEETKPNAAQEALADEWAAALEEQEASPEPAQTADAGGRTGKNHAGAGTGGAKDEDPVQKANFESLSQEPSRAQTQEDVNLDVVLDIPVTLSMEIGRTRIPIRNLLQLNQGSVVELDRLAGEPLDVFANGTLIAHGEVVVVNEKFGIRLTDVMSPTERVKKLK